MRATGGGAGGSARAAGGGDGVLRGGDDARACRGARRPWGVDFFFFGRVVHLGVVAPFVPDEPRSDTIEVVVLVGWSAEAASWYGPSHAEAAAVCELGCGREWGSNHIHVCDRFGKIIKHQTTKISE